MISLTELRLLELLREREEPLPSRRPRERILMLDAPWPWPWAILELGAEWICYVDIEPSRDPKKPPKRRAARVEEWAEGSMVAIRCTTPSDLNLLAELEKRGIMWPSCPEEWRSAVVGVARLTGNAWAGRGVPTPGREHLWPGGHPVGWGLSGVLPIDPLPTTHGGAVTRLSPFPEDLLPELRERWLLSRWGCYRHPRLAEPTATT